MSNSNRNKMLLGFGAVVAVFIVAILLWPANVRKEDATGAIGAVQKHRAPQITQQDVVLGNESVKHHQKVLYTDFLADAAKLRAMAASRDQAAARVFSRELTARYADEFVAALAEAEMAAKTSASRLQMEADIAALNSRFAAERAQLADADMLNLNSRLSEVMDLANRESAKSRIELAEGEVADLATRLSSKSLQNEEAAASKVLADVEALLSRSTANISLADEVQYLSNIEMESKVLADFDTAALNEEAQALEARAAANIEAASRMQNEMAARLASMDDTLEKASRTVGSRAGMASSTEMLSRTLNSIGSRLRNQEAASRAASREFVNARNPGSRSQ